MKECTACDAGQEAMVKILKSMIYILQRPEKPIYFEYFTERFSRFFSLTNDTIPGEQITLLNQLMLILFEKLCNDYHLNEYSFLKVVEYCSLPLKTNKVNDLLIYEDDIRDLYNVCAYILGSTQNVVVTRKLLQILIIKARDRKHCRLKNRIFTKCFVTSKVPEIISELLLITEFHLYIEYLSALELILVDDLECQEFVKYHAVDIITKRLIYNWINYTQYTDEDLKTLPVPRHFDLSQRVLWLLVNGYLNGTAAFKKTTILKISPQAWRIARMALIILFNDHHKRKERNSFYLLFRTIWTLHPYVGRKRPATDIFCLGFLTEVPYKDPSSWLSKVKFFPDSLDLEFKIFVMSTLCTVREIPYIVEALKYTSAVPSLLIIIDTTENVIWTPAQRRTLIHYALLGLQNVLNVMADDFIIYKGPKRLVFMIEQILKSTLPSSLLFPTLSCINKSLNIPDYQSEMIQKYEDTDAIHLLTKMLLKYFKSSHLSQETQNNISVMLCILGKLTDKTCKNCRKIIEACLKLLKGYPELKISCGFLQPRLLLAIMVFIWECLMCSFCNLDMLDSFIRSGGIYAILDAVEEFPLAIKLVGLSMLCDFCEKGVSSTCLLTWRGKDGATIVPFLLKLYRKQTIFDQQLNKRRQAPKDKSNLEMEISNPAFNLKSVNSADSGTVLLELLGNCKPKISALLHILSCCPQANAINESYLISTTVFNDIDKVTAVAAEHYFKLKYGEAWVDVEEYFQTVGCKPLVFDKALLRYRINEHKRLLGQILSQQNKYQLQEKVKETKLEYALYNELSKQVLSESLDALQELKNIAILSNNKCKMQEYHRMVEKLLPKWMLGTYPSNYHKTLTKAILVSDIIKYPNPEDPLQEDILRAIRYSGESNINGS